MLLLVLALQAAPPAAATSDASGDVQVLLVGNSLSYVNNLPALFNALAAGQPGQHRYHADLIAAPGGTISERWHDGIAAGEIASGHWQVLVLQERGGMLACLATPAHRDEPECAASLGAHRKFARLAQEHGLRTLVLGTWGPDSIWQSQLSHGLLQLASGINAEPLDTGPAVRAYARSHPQTAMYSDAVLHPTLEASLLMAIELYRKLTGAIPTAKPLEIAVPLVPPRGKVLADQLFSEQSDLVGDGAVTHIGSDRLQSLIDAVAADK